MNKDVFQSMLGSMTTWAKSQPNSDNIDVNTAKDICNKFVDRIYRLFVADTEDGLVDFQRVVLGMSEILHGVSCSYMLLNAFFMLTTDNF
jgi:hypothetical protein